MLEICQRSGTFAPLRRSKGITNTKGVCEVNVPNKIRVAVLDDDDLARLGGMTLLARDLRTSIVFDCASPEELLTWLVQTTETPDVVLLDIEYRSATYPLGELLLRLSNLFPEITVVGLTQFGDPEILYQAMQHDLGGLLLKSEVSLSLATAAVNAANADFICTHGIKHRLEEMGYDLGENATVQESWRLHPELTPRLKQVFWLCLVYGLSAKMAAHELYVAYNSVERYRARIYEIVSDNYHYDKSSLAEWEHLLYPVQPEDPELRKAGYWGQDWAFQIMTMPPRVNREYVS